MAEVSIGDFDAEMIDGKKVKLSQFRGKVMLVTFGYTHCRDGCAKALSTLAELLRILDSEAGEVAPIVITVDPKRDTPQNSNRTCRHSIRRLLG